MLLAQLSSIGDLSSGPNAYLSGIKQNNTDIRSLTLSGTVMTDGTCKRSQYLRSLRNIGRRSSWGIGQNHIAQLLCTCEVRNQPGSSQNRNDLPLERRVLSWFGQEWNLLVHIPKRHLWIQRIWHVIRESCNKVNTNWTNLRHHSLYGYHERRHSRIDTTNEFILCFYKLIRTKQPKLFLMETTPCRLFEEDRIYIHIYTREYIY